MDLQKGFRHLQLDDIRRKGVRNLFQGQIPTVHHTVSTNTGMRTLVVTSALAPRPFNHAWKYKINPMME
jgi:hypothetical protein